MLGGGEHRGERVRKIVEIGLEEGEIGNVVGESLVVVGQVLHILVDILL